jgi:hypothetical protein
MIIMLGGYFMDMFLSSHGCGRMEGRYMSLYEWLTIVLGVIALILNAIVILKDKKK